VQLQCMRLDTVRMPGQPQRNSWPPVQVNHPRQPCEIQTEAAWLLVSQPQLLLNTQGLDALVCSANPHAAEASTDGALLPIRSCHAKALAQLVSSQSHTGARAPRCAVQQNVPNRPADSTDATHDNYKFVAPKYENTLQSYSTKL
jgi:hypothetical protein